MTTRTQRRTRSSSRIDSQKSVRTFQLVQFKALDDAQGIFEGYLAVFNNEDLGGDIIVPGAFTKTLQELAEKQQHRAELGAPSARYLLPIFWNHDADCPIGGFTELREDSIGLFVRAELDMDKEAGRDAYSGLSKGYVPGLSIGYINSKPPVFKGGVRYLTELRLLEGSATPIPMNEEALALDVKNQQQHSSDSAPQSAQTGADAVSRTKPRMHHRSKRSAQTAQGADETTAQQPEQLKARDFATVYTTDRDASDLLEDLDDMWEALRESVVSIMIDGGDSSDPTPGVDADKVDTALLSSSLAQFSAAVTQWANAAALQDCWEQIADSAAERADWYTEYATEPDDYYGYGYMSRTARRDMQRKAGRVMSSSNHQEMGDALEGLKDGLDAAQAQYKALSDMHGRMAPNADGDDGSDAGDSKRGSQDAGDSKSDTRSDATGDRAGLHDSSTTLDLKKVDGLVLSMRAAMLASQIENTLAQTQKVGA